MSIDRIGKANELSGVIPSETGSIAPSREGTGEVFRVSQSAPPQAVTSLERVRCGEITLSQYLDSKVEVATQHLTGRISAEQLEFIQNSLRDQLASDPILVDLVKAASGSVPPTRE